MFCVKDVAKAFIEMGRSFSKATASTIDFAESLRIMAREDRERTEEESMEVFYGRFASLNPCPDEENEDLVSSTSTVPDLSVSVANPHIYRPNRSIIDSIDVHTEPTEDGIKVKLIGHLKNPVIDESEDIIKEDIRLLKED